MAKVEITEHDTPIEKIHALIDAFDGHCKIRISQHDNSWCVVDIKIMEDVELSFFSVKVINEELLPKEID
jgi:hypothetical protein